MWSGLWGFLKALPVLLNIYKELKARAKERGIEKVDELAKDFMSEVKGNNDSALKAKYINDMFR